MFYHKLWSIKLTGKRITLLLFNTGSVCDYEGVNTYNIGEDRRRRRGKREEPTATLTEQHKHAKVL